MALRGHPPEGIGTVSDRKKRSPSVAAWILVASCSLPLLLVGQTVVFPPGSPALTSAADWAILHSVATNVAFRSDVESELAVGPVSLSFVGVPFGFGTLYQARRSPAPGSGSDAAFAHYHCATGQLSASDSFRFPVAAGNGPPDNNVVVWDASCYAFLVHVLGSSPARLLEPIDRGLSVRTIFALPDPTLVSSNRKILVIRYVGATDEIFLRVSATDLGLAGFGPLSID